jgi:alpha-L-fucosidase
MLLVGGAGCTRTVKVLYREDASSVDDASSEPDRQEEAGQAGDTQGPGGEDALPSGVQSCPSQLGAPAGVGPLPTPEQVAYQRTELTAFIHFGFGTFDGNECHFGAPTFDGTDCAKSAKDSPSVFFPTALDTVQWATALKEAGFGQATLTAKFGTGFCLWQSAYTDYSVKSSPWKKGQGDVVKEFAAAMHAAGMRVGFYLSPYDSHYPSSDANYETYFRNQVTELLTGYGDVHELWIDGYNAPKTLDWPGILKLAKMLHPPILLWVGPEVATTGAEIRWIGNQEGRVDRSTSSVGDVPNGGPSNVWYPFESNVSDRTPNWFWRQDASPMSLESLQTVYFNTVGRNTTLILNIPPATTGQFDTPDLDLLRQFGAWYASLYQTNLLRGQPAIADSDWTATGFDAAKAVDNDVCSYWAAAEGTTSGRLAVTAASPITFHVLSIREPIELGERATGYHVEIKQNGTWNRTPTDASGAAIKGTVIGQRQLWRLNPTTAEAIALVIDSAKGVPAIAEFSAY